MKTKTYEQIGAWKEPNGKYYIASEIKDSDMALVSEVVSTDDSPTGFYRTGPLWNVHPERGVFKNGKYYTGDSLCFAIERAFFA